MSEKNGRADNGHWLPGTSGNPGGPWASLDPEDREALRMSSTHWKIALHKIGDLNKKQLKAIIDDPETPIRIHMIASVVLKCITKGDVLALEAIMNRVLGKSLAKVEFAGAIGHSQLKPEIIEQALKDPEKLKALEVLSES